MGELVLEAHRLVVLCLDRNQLVMRASAGIHKCHVMDVLEGSHREGNTL